MIKLAVIGDPIGHSLSPDVHSAALEALDIPYAYEKVRVKKGELEAFLRYAKAAGIDGFNLTMPHKVDILPYLYGIDQEAERYQSVNTVRVREGKLYGYNTDADGYMAALSMTGKGFRDSRVVILGAGGVVRTLALKAAWEGAREICVLNRTAAKAEAVCRAVTEKTGARIFAGTLERQAICDACVDCDILLNATPLGMHGVTDNFSDFSFLDALPEHALVSDLIYNPERTELLQEAERRGLTTLNGLGMLIFQALLADRIYTDVNFDMKRVYPLVARAVRTRF